MITRVLVDTVAVTFKRLPVSEVVLWAESVAGGEFVAVEGAMLGYRQMVVGPNGGRVLWDNATRVYAGDVHVILPGKVCETVSERDMRSALAWTLEHGGTATRIDLALDDFAKRVSPQEFREHRLGPTAVTMTRPGRYHGDDATGGYTYYVGSRSSRMMARVYDKSAESGGATDAVRYELEAKAEAAEQLQRQLVDENWGEVWASQFVKLIDFRERHRDSNVTRCPRVRWFESLVGDAKRAAPYMAVAPRTADEALTWLKRQCGPMLVVVGEVYGGQVLHHILSDGRGRLTSKHRELIARGVAA